MTQRVDVRSDDGLVLLNQLVTNTRMRARVWEKAAAGRRVTITPSKPPAPPLASDAYLEPVRNLLVFATVTDDTITLANRLPGRWKFLFTADPAYRLTRQQVAAVKASGHRAFAWCDCRTTLPVACRAFAVEYGLEDWYGQAETAAEFDVAHGGGAKWVIGNLGPLRPDQLALVASKQMLFALELYLNVHPWEKPDWHGVNAGVGGNCGAVYASQSEGSTYTPVASQPKEWFHPHGSWYVEGFRPADWETVRSWG